MSAPGRLTRREFYKAIGIHERMVGDRNVSTRFKMQKHPPDSVLQRGPTPPPPPPDFRPRVVWIGTPTEIEDDIKDDCEDEGIRVDFWTVPNEEERRPRTLIQGITNRLERETYDLAVFRFPYFLSSEYKARHKKLFRSRPIVCWQSEQGPTLPWALDASEGFPRVYVNNRYEMSIYRERFPEAEIGYLPFGCKKGYPQDEMRTGMQVGDMETHDLIADGKCHYQCGSTCSGELGNGVKRESVETLVFPFLGIPGKGPSLSLYGDESLLHGWKGVLGAQPYYRGKYAPEYAAHVYAWHRVYLGISWNWKHGGYGAKLARALASGIAVLWHRTPWMALDGLREGQQLSTTAEPGETHLKVRRFLASRALREDIGAEGRAFALREWRWGKNLARMIEEVNAKGKL